MLARTCLLGLAVLALSTCSDPAPDPAPPVTPGHQADQPGEPGLAADGVSNLVIVPKPWPPLRPWPATRLGGLVPEMPEIEGAWPWDEGWRYVLPDPRENPSLRLEIERRRRRPLVK